MVRRRRLGSFEATRSLKKLAWMFAATATGTGILTTLVPAAGEESATAFVTQVPLGYRDWKLVSVAREEGALDDVRAILGNDSAIGAYRAGKLPFPEGTMIVRLAWSLDANEENDKTFGKRQSFVAGAPKNGTQFMLKDSKKFAATGGWGFGQFDDGVPVNVSALKGCFPCHRAVKARDLVFTKYAP